MHVLYPEKYIGGLKPTFNVLRPIATRKQSSDKNFQDYFQIRDFIGYKGEMMFDGRAISHKVKAISLSKRGKVLESGFKKQKRRLFRNINSKHSIKSKRYPHIRYAKLKVLQIR